MQISDPDTLSALTSGNLNRFLPWALGLYIYRKKRPGNVEKEAIRR
jgi:hypothetical protein